ncbi:MAG: NAD(P)-binding protein [Planctomycetia bacterium]|nr:NAD(P)-binding protein [Planctomycetia bacterium]
MKISIIGGSIAGLTTALRLQNTGHKVSVWERRSPTSSGGFGMLLDQKTLNHLTSLGLDLTPQLQKVIIYEAHDVHSGRIVRHGLDGSFAIQRSTLIDHLRKKINTSSLNYDFEFTHFEPTFGNSIQRACFSNGHKIEADLFLGADGVRSSVRNTQVPGPDLPPVKTVEIVGISEMDTLPPKSRNTFKKYIHQDRGIAFGIVPCGGNKVIWYFQIDNNKWPQALGSLQQRNQWLIEELAHWPIQVRRIAMSGGLENTHLWRTTDRDLPLQFHRGNTLLIGDAAHPLLTFTSQGVGSSIEDAVTLGFLLDEYTNNPHRNLDDCLSKFATIRKPVLQGHLENGRDLQQRFLGLRPHCLDTYPVSA